MGLLIFLVFLIAISCSGNGSNTGTLPDESSVKSTMATASHNTWGMWQFTADPVAKTLDCVRLRAANFHLNALPFLEPPPFVNLTLESLEFNGDIIETDIGLRHPFLGLTEFTGFDVCGIFIANGTLTGYGDGIVMTGEGDTRLLNPDGYSRWWNPSEFPVNTGTIFGYNDGLLGTPDSLADFNGNVNGYKYYADSLGTNDDLSSLPLSSRGQFSAGQKNIRHYTIEMGSEGLIFNYAVDACWHFPEGDSPWTVPDDFPRQANRPEPYRISMTVVGNTLYYVESTSIGGGTAQIQVDVYDWFDAGLNTLDCRSLCGIPAVTGITPIGGGVGYSTYYVDLDGSSLDMNGETDLMLICASDVVGYQDLLPGESVASYFTYPITIFSESTETGWALTWGSTSTEWGRGVGTDNLGNIYATGTYRGTIDLDPSDEGVDIHPVQGSSDIFLSKFNSNGDFQWGSTWGTGSSEDVRTPVVDSNGNIYLAARSGTNGVLLKHDSSGNLLWSRSWGGPVWTRACTVDNSDNAYITGFYSGTVDFDPDDIDVEERTPVAQEDIFLSKFDSDGDFLWVLSWGGNDKDKGHAVFADDFGNVYAGGGFRSSSVDFDPDPVDADIQYSNGVYDCYLSKFDSTGDFQWANTWGSGGNDQCYDIGTDDSGYCYVTGYAGGSVDYDPGSGIDYHSGMAFLSKFDSDGAYQWAHAWGSTCYGYNLCLHGSDYIYISGTFRYTIDFDPGPGDCSLTSNGSTDSYITKFDSSGNHQWARSWGWGGAFDAAYDVGVDNAGNAYAEGYFGGNTDFDPTAGEDWHNTHGDGDIDAYLLKLLPDGTW